MGPAPDWGKSLMIGIYNLALLPLRALTEVWALGRGLDPRGRVEWAERLGRGRPGVRPGGVWLHGASVGEGRLVTTLAGALRQRDPAPPLAVSAVTATGRAGLPEPPEVDAAFFAPLDFRGPVRRVLHALRPGVLALVETELWPNLLRESERSGVAVVILNARLAPERMGRYHRLGRLYRPLLDGLARVGAQSDDDAERFRELGVPAEAVEVTGNLKYDLPAPDVDSEGLRQRFGLAAERPVLVAGSTAAGEEQPLLEACVELRRAHPDLLLVLAPRHVDRADEVEALVRARGLQPVRLSAGDRATECDVLLVDTLGQLSGLYALAWVAFVGGSLVPRGGHNLLEPAALGVPVLFGPHTQHVSEPARALEQGGGGIRVRDSAELVRHTGRLLADPSERRRSGDDARRVIERNRGALERSVELVCSALRGSGSPASGGAA